jgi:peptidoglycan hydrolase-like protein with peptidoglycan-binding domain
MVINYDKYILSTGTHYISNSGSDERKQYHGGKAGDQTGHEFELKGWYSRPWTVVLRWPDPAVGLKIAQLGIAAALNNKIGYDQYQRKSYWTQLEKVGYDPSKITTACEEDCTAGVTANCKAAGYLLGIKALQDLPIDTYSGNMKSRFVRAGFKALTEKKYLTSASYLLPGDVLLYESHHGATNITYGKSVRPKVAPVLAPISGGAAVVVPAEPEGLRRGDEGSAVMKMQNALLLWKPDCLPKWGADGDFGAETENALEAYQKEAGLPVTGIYDEATRKALTGIGKAQRIEATADVYVRSAPGKDNRELGVLKKGQTAPYQGEKSAVDGRDWYLIEFDGKNGWVSSKYSKVV